MTVYGAVLANTTTAQGSFAKSDPSIVAFTKTGAFAVSLAVNLTLESNSESQTYVAGTVVTMPGSPVAGTDYAIWANTNGTLQATDNHTTPPTTGARKIGGSTTHRVVTLRHKQVAILPLQSTPTRSGICISVRRVPIREVWL